MPLLPTNSENKTVDSPSFHYQPHRSFLLFLKTPAILFLIIGFLVGGAYCVAIPYGAGFDEETHLVRIMDIAWLHLLPNRSKNATMTYRDFFNLSYQRRKFNDPAADLFSPEKFQQGLDNSNMLRVQTRSIYSPIIFFPQAFVVGIFWRILQMPIIPVVILQRLAGLLLYLLGGYLTIRLLPFGKWVFAILALSPMALFQAATLNADGYTNAVCFLLIGMTLNVFARRPAPITPRQIWILSGLALLVGMAKPGYVVMLLILLLLSPSRFPSKKWVAVLAAAAALSVVFMLVWMQISVPYSHFSDGGSQSLSKQLTLILANPLDFIWAFIKGSVLPLPTYFKDWIGSYGYWVGVVPEPIFTLYPLAILVALFTEPRVPNLSWKNRLFTFTVFLLSSAAILFMYFYLHYSPNGSGGENSQGRYFIPTAPLLCLSLTGLVTLRPQILALTRAAATTLLLAALGYYSIGLYATYYTECGYTVFDGGSCVLPVYKNLEVGNPPEVKINQEVSTAQSFTSHCGKVESVRVLIKTLPASTTGTLRVSLLDNQKEQVITSQDFPVSQIKARDILVMPVQPPASTPDGKFQIKLESPDIPAPDGIGLTLREGAYYQGGRLLANGTQMGADSVFFYSCPNPGQ
jgi:uncharacterized membrane protein